MGIKSYVAAKAGEEKKRDSHILIKDIMVKQLIVFRPEQTVVEAMEILVKNKISGGPVVNSKGDLIGIISEGDCLKEISNSRYYNIPMASHKLEEFMSKDVDTFDADMDLFDVCELFHKNKRRRFPVLSQGKLVGQVSQIDVLRAILNAKHQVW